MVGTPAGGWGVGHSGATGSTAGIVASGAAIGSVEGAATSVAVPELPATPAPIGGSVATPPMEAQATAPVVGAALSHQLSMPSEPTVSTGPL